jgi:hypothetical protein|eukprot:COSAG01_NODE_704_length_14147_cov_5.083648_3_plen_120_part_00
MEVWSGPLPTYDGKWYLYISRAISHFCMPGFFYLMGIGMALFTVSRMRRGWRAPQILRHFGIRGILLVFFGRVVATRDVLEEAHTHNCTHHHGLSYIPPGHLPKALGSTGITEAPGPSA